MKIVLISIGDELLLGQTINTNAAWLGTELSLLGGDIIRNTVIRDQKTEIIQALDDFFNSESDVLVITGGLGPTKDDITKQTLAEYFNADLVLNQDVLDHVEGYFKKFNRPMLEVNTRQAYLPENALIFHNDLGTAPGMCFEIEGKIVISLPGVPYEMKGLMKEHGFGFLKERFKLSSLYFQIIHAQGIGESFLADRIGDLEDKMKLDGISLAYLPSPGLVRLRLSGKDVEFIRNQILYYITIIEERMPHYFFGRNGTDLPAVIGNLLKSKDATIGTVESCTGGALAASIVSVPGSSAYYEGSFLTYSDAHKKSLVQVSPESLNNFGAVSREVVLQMAKNGRRNLGLDYCLSTSGIAGPDGGSADKPVGTVWIGLATPTQSIAKKFVFGTDRQRNIDRTVLTALNILRCNLLGIEIE